MIFTDVFHMKEKASCFLSAQRDCARPGHCFPLMISTSSAHPAERNGASPRHKRHSGRQEDRKKERAREKAREKESKSKKAKK